ncbi:MAG: hypothetical protein KZQ58_08505 [gamma proteobacterium symbiont of Bathyaustriella thionipta]|nr:hypothetical protein [gamma proteobacterium symbiont of Bathyaustriella thionipta]
MGGRKSASLLLLIVLPLCLYSVVLLRSELSLLAPLAHLQQAQHKQAANSVVSERDIERIAAAIRQQPLSSRLCAKLGQAQEWLSQSKGLLPDKARLRQAQQAYQCALHKAPLDISSWVNLSVVLLKAERFDEGGLSALQKAIKLGRYESLVHKRALWLALAHWDELDERQQAEVVEMSASAMVYDIQSVLYWVAFYEKSDIFRAVIEEAGQLGGLKYSLRDHYSRLIYPIRAD